MKKIIIICLLSIVSFLGYSQFTLQQIKDTWAPRYMPSTVNLDSTWSALWNRGTTTPITEYNYVTTASFSVTASTTTVSVTGLTTTTLTAGATYQFEATLFSLCDATGGIKVGLYGTQTPTYLRYNININGAPSTVVTSNNLTSYSTAVSSGGGITNYIIVLRGTIVVGTAQTLSIQFAQSSSNLTSEILQGSTLSIKKL